MFGVADLQVAKAGEHMSVARVACGHDAVEHVHAVFHAKHQVFGRAHAHQVAWLVRGQTVRRVGGEALHVFLGLAHADPAHGVAGEIHFHQLFERFLPQVFEHAALHDAEERIGVLQAGKFDLAASRPAQAQFHAGACLAFGGDVAFGFVGRALVELHHDVGVQHGLDLHAGLGREKEPVAVYRAGEFHAFLADFAHLPE